MDLTGVLLDCQRQDIFGPGTGPNSSGGSALKLMKLKCQGPLNQRGALEATFFLMSVFFNKSSAIIYAFVVFAIESNQDSIFSLECVQTPTSHVFKMSL